MKKAQSLFTLFLMLLLASCASVSSPPGGPRDTTPPKVLKTTPNSAQLNFYSTEVVLVFDEYIQLKNPTSEIQISPPFEGIIKTKLKGKTLIITLPEYPKINSTYQMHFGQALVDVNEGNVLENFLLVFSTGDYIDSLSLSGSVLDAYTKVAKSGLKVYLYNNYSDSSLLLKKPNYITMTDSSGNYTFNHLAKGNYRITSHGDKNKNGTVDPKEDVGVSEVITQLDSNKTAGTLRSSIFDPQTDVKLIKTTERNTDLIQLVFNQAIDKKDLKVYSLDFVSTSNKDNTLPFRFGKSSDTLYVFTPFEKNHTEDTLSFVVIIDSDTLQTSTRTKKNNPSTKPRFHLIALQQGELLNTINLQTNYPIRKTNSDSIQIINRTDSTFINPIEVLISDDRLNIQLKVKTKFANSYSIALSKGFAQFINNKENEIDTLSYKNPKKEELSTLELIIGIDSNHNPANNKNVLEIYKEGGIGSKTQLFAQIMLSKDTVLLFNNIPAGDYYIISFIDQNGDGSWTPGDFTKNRQPEALSGKKLNINVRANWENKNIQYKIN
ncbi:MAG: hypothetical protein ACI9NN_001053 [Bacteroidia bacterium]|jgi:uncharacterized protein (DUF2141 family)